MPTKEKKLAIRFYAESLRALALFCRFFFNFFGAEQKEPSPLRIALLISRPQDVELLAGLSEKAKQRKDLLVSFWMLKKCDVRFPDVLPALREQKIIVNRLVSFANLLTVIKELTRIDVFLSTVESTAARHKLPYILTRMANAANVPTYTLQHGFENIGLNYRDKVHGADVKFAARTILTWGPTEELPAWVGHDTLDKAIAVGCPKGFATLKSCPSANVTDRPIIAIFDNLHWHRYDDNYRAAFLQDMGSFAEQRQEFRFVLRSHPISMLRRDKEMTNQLRSMDNVEVADLVEEGANLTTHWLLSNALGVITTPSTIALDAALAGVPVAVSRYGLDLSYYSPLCLLDDHSDWQFFLDCLTEESGICNLRAKGEKFTNRVLVSGEPNTEILDLMVERLSKKAPSGSLN